MPDPDDPTIPPPAPPDPPVDATETLPCALILGPAGLRRVLEPDAALRIAHLPRLSALTAAAMAAIRPDLVLAPLLDPGFDILDVAGRLAVFGYRGRLRAVAGPLPNPAAVVAEVRGHCGQLDFGLIVLAEGQAPVRI